MERYLIQRITAGGGWDNPFSPPPKLKNGGFKDEAVAMLKPILGVDYMGAAEYEGGAVPRAVAAMADDASLFESRDVPVKATKDRHGGTLYLFCHPDHADRVAQDLEKLAGDSSRRDPVRVRDDPQLVRALAGEGRTTGGIGLEPWPFFYSVKKEQRDAFATLLRQVQAGQEPG